MKIVNDKLVYDNIIIGAGPAGLTAALYLARAGKDVVIFDGGGIGGQMAKAPWIENYPGVGSVTGVDLAEDMYAQLAKHHHHLELEDVVNIEYHEDDYYIVTGEFDTVYNAKNLIIATGGKPITLNVPGIDRDNVHYCATCDGAFYKGKDVVVIGDANSALQYAYDLSYICKSVNICAIGNRLYGEQVWIDKVEKRDNITVNYCFETMAITPAGVKSTNNKLILADGIFVAIGFTPNIPNVKHIYCPRDAKGAVFTADDLSTQPGVYFIGDVRSKKYKQIASAVNDGMEAALNIIKGER